MNFTSVQNLADNYFSTINPIAEKICTDIAATKDAYEDLWKTLSFKEQNKIIDETIIHPEVVLKYSFCTRCNEKFEYFYPSSLHIGEKFGDLSWHDEHSAPFSWMTRSQLDLRIFCDSEAEYVCNEVSHPVPDDEQTKKKFSSKESFVDPPAIVLGGSSSKLAYSTASHNKCVLKSNSIEAKTLFEKLKCTAAILRSQTIKSALNKAGIESSQRKFTGHKNDILLQSTNKCTVVPSSKISKPVTLMPVISKPKSPPPPPPNKAKCSLPENSQNYSETKALLNESSHVSSKNLCTKSDKVLSKFERFETDSISNSSQSADILVPKTGFDFLDNW